MDQTTVTNIIVHAENLMADVEKALKAPHPWRHIGVALHSLNNARQLLSALRQLMAVDPIGGSK